jgi:hypothetical protein
VSPNKEGYIDLEIFKKVGCLLIFFFT